MPHRPAMRPASGPDPRAGYTRTFPIRPAAGPHVRGRPAVGRGHTSPVPALVVAAWLLRSPAGRIFGPERSDPRSTRSPPANRSFAIPSAAGRWRHPRGVKGGGDRSHLRVGIRTYLDAQRTDLHHARGRSSWMCGKGRKGGRGEVEGWEAGRRRTGRYRLVCPRPLLDLRERLANAKPRKSFLSRQRERWSGGWGGHGAHLSRVRERKQVRASPRTPRERRSRGRDVWTCQRGPGAKPARVGSQAAGPARGPVPAYRNPAFS